jgi:hypothetical protein
VRRFAALLVLAGSLAGAPAASAASFFQTPSGNIACQAAGGRVMCGVLSSRHGDSIPAYWVRRTGLAHRSEIVGDPATDVPVLRYGRSKHLLRGGVVCTSRKTGLTCRNRSGHGFFLSRESQRRF